MNELVSEVEMMGIAEALKRHRNGRGYSRKELETAVDKFIEAKVTMTAWELVLSGLATIDVRKGEVLFAAPDVR